jgi:hypothetical protein
VLTDYVVRTPLSMWHTGVCICFYCQRETSWRCYKIIGYPMSTKRPSCTNAHVSPTRRPLHTQQTLRRHGTSRLTATGTPPQARLSKIDQMRGNKPPVSTPARSILVALGVPKIQGWCGCRACESDSMTNTAVRASCTRPQDRPSACGGGRPAMRRSWRANGSLRDHNASPMRIWCG